MNTSMTPGWRLGIKLGLLATLLVAGSVVADHLLAPARFDLTENQRYTLSPACREMLAGLKEPVTLNLYASAGAARGAPALQSHVRRVHELLEQMRRAGKGMVQVKEWDPEPYSEAEQKAAEAGLEPVQISGDKAFYLGLVGTNAVDGRETLPFLHPAHGEFLESDMARMIAKLARAKKPKVGLLTSLPMAGGRSGPWMVNEELKSFFDVVPVPSGSKTLPPDLDLLLVVHPKNCDEALLRQVDAFAHAGKPVVLALDAFSFSEMSSMQGQGFAMPVPSDFGPLTRAWGLSLATDQVAADRTHALRQGAAGQRGTQDILPILDLSEDTFDKNSPFFTNISRLRLVMAGVLSKTEGSSVNVQSLVRLGQGSGTLPTSTLMMGDPASWKRSFSPDDKERMLVAYVTGPAPLAYPDAPTAESGHDPAKAAAKEPGKESDKSSPPHAAPPTGNLKVLAIADADFIQDMWWATPVRLGNQTIGYDKQADNADFLLGAMDILAAGGDLAQIHARGGYDRPFTYVDNLRKEAEAREMGQLAVLEEKRRETQRKISQLRGGSSGKSGEITLSAEQKTELENYLRDYAKSGEELRHRRYELNKDVEQLGTLVTVLNASIAPALVGIAAIVVALWRRRKRKEAKA